MEKSSRRLDRQQDFFESNAKVKYDRSVGRKNELEEEVPTLLISYVGVCTAEVLTVGYILYSSSFLCDLLLLADADVVVRQRHCGTPFTY